ncbi:HTH_48 domain-containing protein [Trichonephila clavipes]|nr:HTH_48 domain-containing protein [Trichonephila clavipes]
MARDLASGVDKDPSLIGKIVTGDDNNPAYRSLVITDFLVITKTTVLPHPRNFPDLAPGVFSLFPKFARRLQGHRFRSADEVKSASQAVLKDMAKNGLQKRFSDLYKRWQKCIVAQGSYFEKG